MHTLTAAADAATDRPRERLWTSGSDDVSDAELLAVVLGTGRRGRPALQIAHELIAGAGGISALARACPHDLTTADGIGPAQAARVVAAMALGVRAVTATRARREALHSAADVRRRLWPRMVGAQHEVFFIIGIDARNGVVIEAEVARGHLTGVDVHPREVFRPAVRAGAAAIVCAHNHPSGDPTPSAQDLALTERLKQAGDALGIPVIDHVVLADDGTISIAEWCALAPATVTPAT